MIKAVTLHYLNLEIKAYNLFAFLLYSPAMEILSYQ